LPRFARNDDMDYEIASLTPKGCRRDASRRFARNDGMDYEITSLNCLAIDLAGHETAAAEDVIVDKSHGG
jgi:hypothetical protein